MEVFGLDPIQATIVIAVIGVLLQVGIGVLRSKDPFDGRKLLSSAIIAVITSFTLVATALQAIPDGIDPLGQFVIIVLVIAGIAGIDGLVKNSGNAILAKAKNIKAD